MPKFKYDELITDDYAKNDYTKRKEWITLLYPYAPYFMDLLKEIQWETEGYKLYDSKIPFMIFGGSAYELFNMKYRDKTKIDLHTFTDPTADIDCSITYLQKKEDSKHKIKEDSKDTLAKHIIDQIATQLKKLSYNFKEWFGDLDEPKQHEYYKHPTRVGPFLIYHSINIETDLRIRVDLLTNTGYQDHFIEILCKTEKMSEQNINKYNNLLTTVSIRGLHVRNIYYELYRSTEALSELLESIIVSVIHYEVDPTYTNSKSLNHLNRALYAMKLLDYLYTETPNDPFIKSITHKNKEVILKMIDIGKFMANVFITKNLEKKTEVIDYIKKELGEIKSLELNTLLKPLLNSEETKGGMRYKRTTRKRQRKRANRRRLNKTR